MTAGAVTLGGSRRSGGGGSDGGSGRRRWRKRSPEVAVDGVVAASAGGDGGSGRQRCRRLVEAEVEFLVAMAAVMDAMNGCMRPANAAAGYSTAGFLSASKSSVCLCGGLERC